MARLASSRNTAQEGKRWAGSAVGGAADKAESVKKGTELIIKLENGQETAIQIPGEQKDQPGDRGRLTSGPNGTKVQKVEPQAAAAQESRPSHGGLEAETAFRPEKL